MPPHVKYHIQRELYPFTQGDPTMTEEFDLPVNGLAKALSVEMTEDGMAVYWLVPDRVECWGV